MKVFSRITHWDSLSIIKVIFVVVFISIPLACIFSTSCNKANGANIELLKQGPIELHPDIVFRHTKSGFVTGFGYYIVKNDGTKSIIVINIDGGVTEVKL